MTHETEIRIIKVSKAGARYLGEIHGDVACFFLIRAMTYCRLFPLHFASVMPGCRRDFESALLCAIYRQDPAQKRCFLLETCSGWRRRDWSCQR